MLPEDLPFSQINLVTYIVHLLTQNTLTKDDRQKDFGYGFVLVETQLKCRLVSEIHMY